MFITVIGGAASGKSNLAENMAMKLGGKKAYLATMKPLGDEGLKRITRHKAIRADKQFSTIECSTSVDINSLKGFDTILLECMSNWVANEYFDKKHKECSQIINTIDYFKNNISNCVIVTNHIFSDTMGYDKEIINYIEKLGELNRYLGKVSDVLIESVYGIPVFHKGDMSYEKSI